MIRLALRPLTTSEDDDDGALVRKKASLNVAMPLISKSSTRNVFEILNLFVARSVTPMSPSVFGRLTFPGMLYWPSVRTLGGESWPVTLVLKFKPVKLSRKMEFDVAML